MSYKNDIINEITIDCLINRDDYEKYTHKNEKVNSKEIKFYKKRIYDLVKRLLTSKDERKNIHPDIQYAFHNLVKVCINYFETIDKVEILQKEYADLNDIVLEEHLNNNFANNNNNNDIDNNTNPHYNDYIMKKVSMPEINNKLKLMDNFVIKKQENNKNILDEEQIIYPKIREFNLKDENLKVKGIKKKNIPTKDNLQINNVQKNNIINNYETNNETNSQTNL